MVWNDDECLSFAITGQDHMTMSGECAENKSDGEAVENIAL